MTSAFRSELLRHPGVDERIAETCEAHFQALVVWNKTHNLTRITDPLEAARLHYLDSLAPLLVWPAPPDFVDVGSGAGFPGLLASLAWPEARGILVEPSQKRVSFLRLVAGKLGVAVDVTGPDRPPLPASRVLSRATFSPGKRSALVPYVGSAGSVAVWGHRHDQSTWQSEVSTWPGVWESRLLHYEVQGIEPRCLLIAARVPPKNA